MKHKTQWVVSSVAVLATWMLGSAGAFGADQKLQDRVTVYLGPGAKPNEAVVTIWMANTNPVIGITLPFKFAPGADSVVLDSLLTTTGRAAAFQVPPPMYKKENQTLLVNMLSAGDSAAMLKGAIPAGEGPIAVLYLGAKSTFPVDAFKIAAVHLPPENELLYVTTTFNSVQPEFALVKKPAPLWPPKTGQAATKAAGKTDKE